ncbi:Kazal-type serine protease inhibitor domain-containing protein [Aminobacter sp. NyZ550]|uniref:Kazal-type serine protease inhibitor family protein n=1 Tax=Aminobacter sp. NyZ550 TaxID=2979870 RepID=UPI0021D58714|nr:Kazal-type serine protease inhibitor domain-containing protein [Aminobacter sp. NyZ550]WAX93984.1 Kazal-type serine protease inhibitor domain-containing protein [Aminobacter sp. NyZ550]
MIRLVAHPVAVLLMALGALVACVPQSPAPGPSRPQACTFEYAPVCGQRGDRTRSFSNSCMARADGFRVIHSGQCRRPEQPTVCPAIYMPVCAVSGARWRTFSNSCLARAGNFRVMHQGRCR